MQPLNRNHVALALGSFVGFWHLIWSILLALGWAKPLVDFILNIHHIQVLYEIMPFEFGKAVGLVIVTFIVGYVFGFVFATGWNICQKK